MNLCIFTSEVAMSEFFDPYNADRPLMLKCSCGRDHSPADHQAEVAADAAIPEMVGAVTSADRLSVVTVTSVEVLVLPAASGKSSI